ncbi:MAG: sodium:proton antiporter [Actinomycetes bacterium]|nr:sodium:proton antiporter [Actinomycetes bacterium]MDX5380009.1 sodium:proton antiporter [Actinomycetes bacterium]MDX5398555.1 sodium:proton antiporter [Actinomycetes bacterium]MDX5449707.1 sodium:proton antiporter [Actinomycetes bacterium]
MEVEWWSMIPFVILLLCIAILPLIHATEHRWEQNSTKLTVALVLGLPVAVWFWLAGEQVTVLHSLWEYVQFVLLLGALFVVSGGIFLTGDLRATPRTNAAFLGIGAVLASFIGTTGAAMLLVRPLLNTNKERFHKVHTIVFLIFIVANTGGLLTPLGDPPLFLGFLRGVPFTWTFSLIWEWLFVNLLLLATYFALDTQLYRKEPASNLLADAIQRTPLGIRGKIHFLFLAMVVLAVAVVPSLDLHAIEEGTATFAQSVPWRELVFLLAGGLSYFVGDKVARFVSNEFSWTPILEVAALFIGIFLAMMPALKFLSQIAPKLPLNELTFFYFTGGLSAFLDNAPTYVTFFEMARTSSSEPLLELERGMGTIPELYLVSISLGAVFMGAMTYIGNGPNFMTKAVADSRGVAMPSFGGYLGWSGQYLLPVMIAMSFIFIAPQLWLKGIGIVLAAGLLGRIVLILRQPTPAPEDIERPLEEITV